MPAARACAAIFASTIIETAKKLNYTIPTSIAGRKVILAASNAAMIDYVRNQFTFYVLDGLNERARTLGVELVSRSIADAGEQIALLNEARQDKSVVGCLFLTLDDEAVLTLTGGFGKPIVLINGDDPAMHHSSVTPCNRSAAHLATQHLLDLGHRRILFLMRRGRRTIERRFEGWQDALRERGLAAADLAVEVSDWLPDLAAEAIARRIEARGLDFTAVLAAGDSLAIGAMMAIQKSGYGCLPTCRSWAWMTCRRRLSKTRPSRRCISRCARSARRRSTSCSPISAAWTCRRAVWNSPAISCNASRPAPVRA